MKIFTLITFFVLSMMGFRAFAIGPLPHTLRENQYDLKFYFLDLNIDKDKDTISGDYNSKLRITIYNVLGALQYSNDHYKMKELIEVSNLNPGIYLIYITDADKKSVLKL